MLFVVLIQHVNDGHITYISYFIVLHSIIITLYTYFHTVKMNVFGENVALSYKPININKVFGLVCGAFTVYPPM